MFKYTLLFVMHFELLIIRVVKKLFFSNRQKIQRQIKRPTC